MTGTFIDTLFICTMTGTTLILTGEWAGTHAGAAMTNAAFSYDYGSIGGIILTVSLFYSPLLQFLAGIITVNAPASICSALKALYRIVLFSPFLLLPVLIWNFSPSGFLPTS